jgi:hypothetical protein
MITPAPVCRLSRHKALSQAACDVIDQEPDGGEVPIPAISALDITGLVRDGRFGLSMDARSRRSTVVSMEGARMAPVDAVIAFARDHALDRADLAPEADRHHCLHL